MSVIIGLPSSSLWKERECNQKMLQFVSISSFPAAGKDKCSGYSPASSSSSEFSCHLATCLLLCE